jgi:hypothetical protein
VLSTYRHGRTFNIFTALKNGDFACATLMLQRGRENVLGRVDVAIMRRPAVRTCPRPYSKICDPSRPRRWHRATRRTDLGTPALVNIDIHRLPSGSFKPQHVSEARPTRIKHRLCHACLNELRRTYVADRYQSDFTNNPRGLLMKMVAPRIGDLRLNGADAVLVSGPLSSSQFRFVLPVMLQSRNSMAIARRRKFLEAKIDADFAHTGLQVIGNLAGEGNIPTPARVLHECSSLEMAFDLTAFPKAARLFEIHYGSPVETDRSRNKRYPAPRPFCSETGTEPRAAAMLIARLGKLAAHCLHGIGMQAQIGSTAGRQLDQIEFSRARSSCSRLCACARIRAALPRKNSIPDCKQSQDA